MKARFIASVLWVLGKFATQLSIFISCWCMCVAIYSLLSPCMHVHRKHRRSNINQSWNITTAVIQNTTCVHCSLVTPFYLSHIHKSHVLMPTTQTWSFYKIYPADLRMYKLHVNCKFMPQINIIFLLKATCLEFTLFLTKFGISSIYIITNVSVRWGQTSWKSFELLLWKLHCGFL